MSTIPQFSPPLLLAYTFDVLYLIRQYNQPNTIRYLLCMIYYARDLLCTMHYVLCIIHYTLCTMHYSLCTMHYILCTIHYALCTMHYSLCTMHYALFTMHLYIFICIYYFICIHTYLLIKLLLIILSPPQLSLIAKVPQFFENFTILSFTMALGAHMRPYSYIYYAPHRDGVLQILPPLEHFVLEMNKLNSKERKIPQ